MGKPVLRFFESIASISPERAATHVVRLAADAEVAGETGTYHRGPRRAEASAQARDEGRMERLWRVVGAVHDRLPDPTLSLHLHDTRGMGIANAFAGLRTGVAMYDAAQVAESVVRHPLPGSVKRGGSLRALRAAA